MIRGRCANYYPGKNTRNTSLNIFKPSSRTLFMMSRATELCWRPHRICQLSPFSQSVCQSVTAASQQPHHHASRGRRNQPKKTQLLRVLLRLLSLVVVLLLLLLLLLLVLLRSLAPAAVGGALLPHPLFKAAAATTTLTTAVIGTDSQLNKSDRMEGIKGPSQHIDEYI